MTWLSYQAVICEHLNLEEGLFVCMASTSDFSLSQRLGGRNLYLVGMMGCGKSHTGPFLAEKLQYGFVDSDQVIEEVSSKSILNIFDEEGEKGFRRLETDVLKAIGERHSLVVATGGGAVTMIENWAVMHQGLVVWINPNRQILLERLKDNPNQRPLIQGKEVADALDLIFSERKKFYAEADVHVEVNDHTPEEVAEKIMQKIPSVLRDQRDPRAPQTIVG